MSWRTPASGNGAPITGYVVIAYRRYTPVKTWSFSGRATRHVVNGLSNGQRYHFNVRAQNALRIGRNQGAVFQFESVNIEVVGPEVRHDLAELVTAIHCPQESRLLRFGPVFLRNRLLLGQKGNELAASFAMWISG